LRLGVLPSTSAAERGAGLVLGEAISKSAREKPPRIA
jgi:hypothetical protein